MKSPRDKRHPPRGWIPDLCPREPQSKLDRSVLAGSTPNRVAARLRPVRSGLDASLNHHCSINDHSMKLHTLFSVFSNTWSRSLAQTSAKLAGNIPSYDAVSRLDPNKCHDTPEHLSRCPRQKVTMPRTNVTTPPNICHDRLRFLY